MEDNRLPYEEEIGWLSDLHDRFADADMNSRAYLYGRPAAAIVLNVLREEMEVEHNRKIKERYDAPSPAP